MNEQLISTAADLIVSQLSPGEAAIIIAQGVQRVSAIMIGIMAVATREGAMSDEGRETLANAIKTFGAEVVKISELEQVFALSQTGS